MKKLILSTLTILALSVSSCSISEDNNDTSNEFVVNPLDFRGTIPSGTVATLNAGTVYKLTGALVVEANAVLTIPAGTRIEATGGTAAYIAVAQDGKIFVNGTELHQL